MYWDRLQCRFVTRRRLLAGAGIGAVGLGAGLAGCGGGGNGDASTSTATSAAATGAPKQGGTLQVLSSAVPPHLDPVLNSAFGTLGAVNQVYSRLWKPKTGDRITPWDFKLEPDLAVSVEQPDKATYIYKLRQGVKWQDRSPVNGRAFVADDVVYSIRRALDNPQSTIKEELASISSLRAVDPNTVEIKTNAPFAPLNTKFGGAQIWMFAHEVVEQKGDLREVLIGTGPFMFDSYTPNVSLQYSRNPSYYGAPRPYVDKLTQNIIVDTSSQEAAFTTGKLDALVVRDRRAFDRLARSVSDVQSLAYDSVGLYAYFRSDKPPFQDVRVRQAFCLTIDYEGLIQAFTSGEGHIDTVVPQAMKVWSLPPSQWGEGAKYHSKPDIAEAKKLLAAAGLANGAEFSIYYSIGATDSFWQAVAAGAEKAGFRMKLSPEEYPVYIGRVIGTSDYVGMSQMSMVVWNDPDEYTHTYLHSGGRRNGSHKNDPELDALIDKQRQEFNNEERKKILGEIEKRNLVQNYFTPTIAYRQYAAWQKRVQNYGACTDAGSTWASGAWIQG